MGSNRAGRLAESVRQEAVEIIEYELDDERLSGITVTGADVTGDLRTAKIYVNIEGDREQVREGLAALRHAGGRIRSLLALRLQLKRVPELVFQYDDSPKRAARIEELLKEERETGHET